jgi:hypothetical protein
MVMVAQVAWAAMAEWIIDGEAPMDVYAYRATRFGDYFSNPEYAAERTREGVKYYYALRFPNDENEWARPHRVSPVHYRLQDREVAGEKLAGSARFFSTRQTVEKLAPINANSWTRPPLTVGRRALRHSRARHAYDLTSSVKLKSAASTDFLCVNADSNMTARRQCDLHAIFEYAGWCRSGCQ